MKVDGSLLVDDPADAGPAARRLEAAGYAGGFSFEGRHDPFLPLAVAAQQTERLELVPAIAIAFARNPMLLANLGYDMQLLSKGRFILGLGTQTDGAVDVVNDLLDAAGGLVLVEIAPVLGADGRWWAPNGCEVVAAMRDGERLPSTALQNGEIVPTDRLVVLQDR